MQRSDDITINSTASVKRRGKGPIVVRKTYCSLLDPSLEEHTASSLCVSSSKVFFYHTSKFCLSTGSNMMIETEENSGKI
ncbi:hypothetical protein Bca4012_089337 [Brassica carinata]